MASDLWAIVPALDLVDLTLQTCLDLLAQSIPVRVLLIDQGSSEESNDQFRQFAEQHHPRVLLWSFNPPLPSLSAAWNRGLAFAWSLGGEEALVVNSDVRLHPEMARVLSAIRLDQEALFVSGVGVTAEEFAAASEPGWTFPGKGGPDFSCFLITKEGHQKYPFDEGFIPAFCVTPDTPVLTKDLQWVPIGEVKVGDELVGVDEHERPRSKGEYHKRCYTVGTVTAVQRRHAPCLQLWLADGREVICSVDHKWLTKYPSGSAAFRWRAASELSIGYRIAAPLQVWTSPYTYDHGWLAGIIDGEGCLRQQGPNRFEVHISQKEGVVLDEIKAMLTRCGISFTWRIRPENNVGVVEIGQRRHVFRTLGEFRPKRLLRNLRWEEGANALSMFSRSAEAGVAIVGIRPVGEQEVVMIETTAKTYLAAGMVAHNCEDNDAHRRYMLGGDGSRIFSVNLPFHHIGGGSRTINQSPEARARFEKQAHIGRSHYRAKWGGEPNQETFVDRFGPVGYPHVTNPELQANLQANKDALAEWTAKHG